MKWNRGRRNIRFAERQFVGLTSRFFSVVTSVLHMTLSLALHFVAAVSSTSVRISTAYCDMRHTCYCRRIYPIRYVDVNVSCGRVRRASAAGNVCICIRAKLKVSDKRDYTISGTEVGSSCQDAKRCSVQDEAECVYCRTVALNISLPSVIFLRNLLIGILPKQKREEPGENF